MTRTLSVGLALGCVAGALVVMTVAARGRTDSRAHVRTASSQRAFNGESWFTLKRGYPTGRTPAGDALARALPPGSPRPGARPQLLLSGSQWVVIGPRPIYVSGTLPYLGRVTAVAPHPTLANTLYIGSDSGGIWKTTDGGTTWTSLTDTIPVPAISSLVVDPVNPQLLYAATIQRTYPTRLLRSTDGGATWDVSTITTDLGPLSPAPCSVNVFKACIPPSSVKLFLDPTRAGSPNTSTIYFAASSHLFRSDDSGRTFRTIFSLPTDLDFSGSAAPTKNPEAQFLRDAILDPARPSRLYTAVAQPTCTNSPCTSATSVIAVYRSVDGGSHWFRQDVSTVNTYTLDNTRYADPGAVYVPRVRLAVAPSNPDTVALAFRDVTLGRPRVLRSTDAGNTWAETNAVANSITWPLGLVFSPTDANTMYVASDGVYRTTNGGQTWTAFSQTHSDNIALAFNAAGTLIFGGDGGLYMGSSGTSLTNIDGTLTISEFYSVASHPTNGLLLAGGLQDNGTAVFQGSLGWQEIVGGDGGDVVFDPGSAAPTLYAEVEWYFDAGSNVFGFYRCSTGGCVNKVSGIDRTLDGPFIPRMAMDPSAPTTLWLTAAKLFRTDNRGDAWTAASPSVATNQRCWIDPVDGRTCAAARYFVAAAVAPTNSQTVYAGTLNGDVWLTLNRGGTWTSVAGPNAGPLPVRAVNDIVVDPLNASVAYAAYSGFESAGSGTGHLFRTTDAGLTWQDLTGNLADMPVNTILIDPDSVSSSSTRVVYVGTDIGVFRATIDGVSTPNWQPFGSGMPPVVVTRLAYNVTTRQLLAATYGRGIWAISSRFK